MNLRIGLTQGYAAYCGCWGRCARTFGPAQGSIATSWGSLMNVKGTITPHPLLKKTMKRAWGWGVAICHHLNQEGLRQLNYRVLAPEDFSLETIHLSLKNSISVHFFFFIFHFNRLKCISVILVAIFNNFFI